MTSTEPVSVVPLKQRGLHYAVSMAFLNTAAQNDDEGRSKEVVDDVIIDTNSSILAVKVCESGGESCELGPEDTWGSEITEEKCITAWKDDGEVIFHSEHGLEFRSITARASMVVDQDSYYPPLDDSMGSYFLRVGDISSGLDKTLDGYNGAGGVLGVAPAFTVPCLKFQDDGSGSVFTSMLMRQPEGLRLFALDLNPDPARSFLEIGGLNGTFQQDLLWGEHQVSASPGTHSLTVFGISICGGTGLMTLQKGRDTRGTRVFTVSWPGVVDTGSACLGLPYEFYENMMVWLPGCKTVTESGVGRPYCSPQVEELPWLSFRLSQHGKELYIPLSSLLLEPDPADSSTGDREIEEGSRRLCVTRMSEVMATQAVPVSSTRWPMISFGTLTLHSLYAAFDTDFQRVGLAQKEPVVGDKEERRQKGEESCPVWKVCKGMQSYDPSPNSCIDPPCNLYLFYTFDEDTKTCRAPRLLWMLGWVIALICAAVEIVNHFLRVFYGVTGLALRGQQQPRGWEYSVGRVIDTCISKVTNLVDLITGHEHRNMD